MERKNSRRHPPTSREPNTIEKPILPRRESEGQQSLMNRRPIPGGAPFVARTSRVKKDDLREALEEAWEKMDEMEVTINEQVEKLGSLHSTDQFRLPDDKIERSVNELRADIRHWSKHFQGVPQKNAWAYLTQDQSCPFSKVSFEYETYLRADDFGPRLLVQSYVWKFLLQMVFGKLLWAGGSCEDAIKGTEALKTLNFLASSTYESEL